MDTRSICRALATSAVLVLGITATAEADVSRHTNPAATATSGDCSVAFPCRIDYAINGASDGDSVVVGPGEYQVEAPLVSPAIDIVGDPGPLPVLVGASTLTSELLSFRSGGTLRHLALREPPPAWMRSCSRTAPPRTSRSSRPVATAPSSSGR